MAIFDRLGPALRLTREIRNLSRAELAQRVGIGERQIGRYETGHQRPELDRLESLLQALDVSLVEFARVLSEIERLARDPAPERASAPPQLDESGLLVPPAVETAFTRLVSGASTLLLFAREITLRRSLEVLGKKPRRLE